MNSTLDLIAVLAIVGLAAGFVWRRYASRPKDRQSACGGCGRCGGS